MANLLEAQDRNNRIVLDTTVSADRIVKIPAMNGHQGDDGRVVPFVIVQGPKQLPVNMQNKSIDLVGTDHDGRIKISGATYKPINMAIILRTIAIIFLLLVFYYLIFQVCMQRTRLVFSPLRPRLV